MSAVTALIIGLAAVVFGMVLATVLAVIRLDNRIGKLEDDYAQRRESAHLRDSEIASLFAEMRENWKSE